MKELEGQLGPIRCVSPNKVILYSLPIIEMNTSPSGDGFWYLETEIAYKCPTLASPLTETLSNVIFAKLTLSGQYLKSDYLMSREDLTVAEKHHKEQHEKIEELDRHIIDRR